MPGPLFDTCLTVDWSARSGPSPRRPSADAIWWCAARRGRHGVETAAPVYERTRAGAVAALAAFLAGETAAGRRVLAGFDFPFGLPSGLAGRLTGRAEGLALWDWLAARIRDGADNANNRFAVAAAANRALGPGPGPFWGRPATHPETGVPTRKAGITWSDSLPERRIVERRVPSAKACWQLMYAGSVGSQALLGIPALARLRADPRLAGRVAVWPFETGLGPGTAQVVLAEIYPSLIPPDPAEPIRDAGQVRAVAGALGRLDAAGGLGALLAGPPGLAGPERAAVAREEAWILGAGHETAMRDAAPGGPGAAGAAA